MGVQIGKQSVARLLQVLGIVLAVQFGVHIGSCSVTSGAYRKIPNTRITTSLTQIYIQHVSVIECCSECNTDNWCNSLSYKSSSKECILSDKSCGGLVSLIVTDNEWVTFAKDVTACIRYLVSGSTRISNSRLSASSNYGMHRPWHARLNSVVQPTGGWARGPSDSNPFIQADFTVPKVITGFALQGRSTSTFNQAQYVKGFKVLMSLDCLSFSYIVDDGNDAKIFVGNSYPEEIVTRNLQRDWILARCVRIKPVQWESYPVMRFDVRGF